MAYGRARLSWWSTTLRCLSPRRVQRNLQVCLGWKGGALGGSMVAQRGLGRMWWEGWVAPLDLRDEPWICPFFRARHGIDPQMGRFVLAVLALLPACGRIPSAHYPAFARELLERHRSRASSRSEGRRAVVERARATEPWREILWLAVGVGDAGSSVGG
jgi:hypothetical protein